MAANLRTAKLTGNPPVIMSRSVSTTLQNLLDLIFRDLLESVLKDITLPGINATLSLK